MASREIKTIDIPIVFPDQIAKSVADITLFSDWVGRTSYQFCLPLKFARLEPSDIVTVTMSAIAHRMRITSTHIQSHGMILLRAVAEDVSTYDFYTLPGEGNPLLQDVGPVPATRMELLDLPLLPAEAADKAVMHIAASGLSAGWTGAAIYRSDDDGANYNRLADVNTPGVIGTALAGYGARGKTAAGRTVWMCRWAKKAKATKWRYSMVAQMLFAH